MNKLGVINGFQINQIHLFNRIKDKTIYQLKKIFFLFVDKVRKKHLNCNLFTKCKLNIVFIVDINNWEQISSRLL